MEHESWQDREDAAELLAAAKALKPPTLVEKHAADHVMRTLGRESGDRALDRMKFSPPESVPLDGSAWLAESDPPLRFAVEGCLNILYGEVGRPSIWSLSALFKFGKTTFVSDFVRCAADGDRFGGAFGFDVNLDEGRRVVHTNYEVADRTLRVKWYRPLKIEHPERFSVLSVRPAQMRLSNVAAADWMVEALVERDAQIWIVDTFSRCGANSGSENSNEDVTLAYDLLLEIGARAGVELVMVIDHMSKGGDGTTSRGATAKQDYPDDFTTGTFTSPEDPSSDRAVSTRGRSADDATTVTYSFDPATRRHTIIDVGAYVTPTRVSEKAKAEKIAAEAMEAVDALAEAGLPPVTKTGLRDACRTGNIEERRRVIQGLIDDGVLAHTGAARSPVVRATEDAAKVPDESSTAPDGAGETE
jgi:hypothetical protein